MSAKLHVITNPMTEIALQDASLDIWDSKYRLKSKDGTAIDATIDETYKRVAKALSEVESDKEKQEKYYKDFLWVLRQGAIPAGRIVSNAGALAHKPATSTINCTVSGNIVDSMDDILAKVHEAGLTLRAGAGIGYCFSTLRPKGAFVSGAGAYTSGPLSFMDIYDKMCFTVSSAGGRRGAQMATFDIGHPDVIEFIRAKREDGRLRQFNLSLLITAEFMNAVKQDLPWHLSFPVTEKELKRDELNLHDSHLIIWRDLPAQAGYIINDAGLIACRIHKTMPAKRLWDIIMSSTYDYAEPGFILIDNVNDMNNNWWCEKITATNPCVAKGTLVQTPDGLKAVETLKEGDTITTVLGQGQIKSIEIHENMPIKRVLFDNNSEICVTDGHIFHIIKDNQLNIETRFSELKVGDKVRVFNSSAEIITTTIIQIESAGIATVYDLYEPVSDTWITEGIVNRGCGEQPLNEYGSCLLGSINLTRFVEKPFTHDAYFDWATYRKAVRIFTRLLDNVVEINGLPLEKQRHEIIHKRRHGMGYLGLGSTLTMLGMKYGDNSSLVFTEEVTKTMAIENWKMALSLAQEKGCAPIMEQDFIVTSEMLYKRPEMITDGYQIGDGVKGKILHAKYSRYMQKIAQVEPELVAQLSEIGARFTHATSVAPTGTIALSLANNASNGIEPSFAHHYARNVIREGKKSKEKVDVYSFELLAYRQLINSHAMPYSENPAWQLPDYFIAADDVTPKQHVDIQAAAQKWIDSSISKTANVPTDYPYEDFKDIYRYAYEQGLKGCFDIDSEYNKIILANGKVITFKELFTLGEGTYIRTGQYSVGRISRLYRNGKKQVNRYVFSNGSILDCTPDHVLETGYDEMAIDDIYKNNVKLYAINNGLYGEGLPELSDMIDDEFIVPATNNTKRYSISSKGRVWRHLFGASKNNTNKWMATIEHDRYAKIRFTNAQGEKSADSLHNFIANALIPNSRSELTEINHIDGDKTNNQPINLERCTVGFNLNHRNKEELQNKSSTGFFGVYEVTPNCFRYQATAGGIKIAKSKFANAEQAAQAREKHIIALGWHKHPHYVTLNYSNDIEVIVESIENRYKPSEVYIVSCTPLGIKEVVDIQIETESDDHFYMVSGIRVHNCTTFRFNPEVFQGVLVKESDLENTTYQFTLEDGEVIEVKGNQQIEYDGEMHSAANLFDALKEGYYGKF